MIEIKDGKIFVDIEGELVETRDPEKIGWAIIDMVEYANEMKLLQDTEY